jgi:hypothetical protein
MIRRVHWSQLGRDRVSALAQTSTASTSVWSNVVIDGDRDVTDDERIDFDVLVPALLSVPEEPEDDYPEGSGPHGC